ncbi:hypothetical protein M2263_001500 [Providencia alcalifaciens]|nr:hypothetical protein [Providencia alcalifaciens]
MLFIRAGLLFEFKMLQRASASMISGKQRYKIDIPKLDSGMSRTSRKMIADYYKRLIDVWLLEENPSSFASFRCKEYVSETEIENILKKMSKFYLHKRMFDGTQGSWLGTLGAFYIEINRYEDPKRAIYYESDNSRTISEEIKEMFLEFGFSVSARSLYLRHKAIKKDNYSKIQHYTHLFELPYVFPWYLNNNGFYDLAFQFKEKDVND